MITFGKKKLRKQICTYEMRINYYINRLRALAIETFPRSPNAITSRCSSPVNL